MQPILSSSKAFIRTSMCRGKLKSRLYIAVALIAGLVYLFRLDIFTPSNEHDTLKQGVFIYGGTTRVQVVLLKETPLLLSNRRKQIEEIFWRDVVLDSLLRYSHYKVSYYLRTKHLTLDFEEGKHYDDTNYSVWTDGVMDWRNHYKDQVGSVEIRTRADGTGTYYVDLLEPKYGFRFLVDPSILIVGKLTIILYKSCMRGSGKSWATSSPRSSHFVSRRLVRERERAIFPLSLL